MSTKTERVVAHNEESKLFIFRPEKETCWDFFLEKSFRPAKTYKTVVAPRVFKNTQNKRDS